MKILYITPVPYGGAGARFRIYQYIPYLSEMGIKCTVSPFLFGAFFKVVYKKGNILPKVIFFVLSFLRRIFDLMLGLRYDIIVVYRESFPFGPPLFEYLLHFFGKKIIFDFDDAIFLRDASDANRMLMKLRCPDNVRRIAMMSRMIFAGNSYLKDYAARFSPNTYVIPTVVDTDKFNHTIKRSEERGRIIIGWTGTDSTQKYLLIVEDVFREILKKYPQVHIRIIGARGDVLGIDKIEYKNWSLEEEAVDIRNFSIGIMPLSDTEWARGKCGFKIIQYMACGVPVVASSVGTNTEIIHDGINGFLASSREEWVKKISLLIEDEKLRQTIGLSGRQFVEKKYSLKEYAHLYCDHIEKVLNEK